MSEHMVFNRRVGAPLPGAARPLGQACPERSHYGPSNALTCGSTCPSCGRPCRGDAGHDPPHECSEHHSW